MIHERKIQPQYFDAVRSGKKTFEFRRNDRDFHMGDYLALNEWDGAYTGRTELVEVKYIFNPNNIMACSGNYIVMSISRCGVYDNTGEADNG